MFYSRSFDQPTIPKSASITHYTRVDSLSEEKKKTAQI